MTSLVDTSGNTLHLTEDQNLRKLNNEEFIGHLMMFSPTGQMSQIFIIEAIRYYAERVASSEYPEDDPKQFINPQAWHNTATYIVEAFDKKYGKQN
jgi:hypothetical protein